MNRLRHAVFVTLAMFSICSAHERVATITERETLAGQWEQVTYASTALERQQSFLVVRPPGTPPPGGWPVLFVLHGHGRSHRTLWDAESTRVLLSGRPFLVVFPDTGKGWWIDSPVDASSRCAQALDEVVAIVAETYPVATERETWGIVGWSMGGYGAMRTAQRRPDRFGFVGTMIGLLDYPRWEGMPENQRYRVPEVIFGEDREVWSTLNPIHALAALRETTIFVVGAEDAFDRTMNRNFLTAAEDVGLDVTVEWIPGGHTFPVVTIALPLVLTAAETYFSPQPQ